MRKLKAIFFDQDGTIIDTEKDGHRVSFNRTFKEFGFPVEWDVSTYHRLLQIAGGKERMAAFLHSEGFGKPVPPEEEGRLIALLHKRKTELMVEMLSSGELPLRPGIKRLMLEAKQKGILVGICTTSNERAAHMIADSMLNEVGIDFILAGDIVKQKKPDPEIYRLALSTAGPAATECFVVEDSRNGVEAARAAGIAVIATTNEYTESEDLSGADVVVTCLGDNDGEKCRVIRGKPGDENTDIVTVEFLESYLNRR